MYRIDAIREALRPLLGWRSPYRLTTSDGRDLTRTDSGLCYQDFHPLLTLDNLRSVAPDFALATPDWTDTTVARRGDMVQYGGEYYTATEATTEEPGDGSSAWALVDPFVEWLSQKTDAAIASLIGRYYTEKVLTGTTRDTLETRVMFDGAGRLSDLCADDHALVGMELVPIRSLGVLTRLDRVALQFTAPTPGTLYLMQSGSDAAVRETTLNYTRTGGVEWFDLGWELPYSSDETETGGSWFVVYDQRQLSSGVSAVRKSLDWSQGPCKVCSRVELLNWQAWTRYLEAHPMRVPPTVGQGDPVRMWDVAKNVYTYQSNWGLNFRLTVACDLTDLITEQRAAFQTALGLQVASDLLREFAYNPSFRLNRTQQNLSRNDILYELDGDSTSAKKSGIGQRLTEAIEAVKLSTEGLARVCLPCKAEGIRYRTV
jgi:hypothetical protein